MKMQRFERNPEFGHNGGNGRNGDDHLLLLESSGRGRSRVEGAEDRHKKSTNKSTTRHTKRSPSERRFKCDQMGCDRMFFTRKDVKRHMVVHTGIRNFACPFCQQRFGRKDHLVRHAKKSHNRDTRSCATGFGAHASSRKTGNNFKLASAQPGSSGMTPQMFSHVPTTSTSIAHPAAVHHHHHLNNHLSYGSNGQSLASNDSQLLLLTSTGSTSHYISHNVPSLNETPHFSSSIIRHENHEVPSASPSSVHQHQLTKTCDTGGHFFSFPMPLSSFPEHSLMQGCFTASSSSRSLYPTPSSSHHHFASSTAHHGMSGISVPGHHHHHPSEPSAFPVDFNPQLPHFNQAFQQ